MKNDYNRLSAYQRNGIVGIHWQFWRNNIAEIKSSIQYIGRLKVSLTRFKKFVQQFQEKQSETMQLKLRTIIEEVWIEFE